MIVPIESFSIGKNDDSLITYQLENPLQNFTLSTNDDGVWLNTPTTFWINGIQTSNADSILLPLNQPIDIAGCGFILLSADQETSLVSLPKRKKNAHIDKKNIVVIASLLFLTLSLSIFAFFYIKKQDSMISLISREDVYQSLKKEKLFAIVPVWHGSSIALYGRCEQSSQLQTFFNFLYKNNIRYINNIICNDQIISGINDVLVQYGYDNIDVSYGGSPGFFILSGYIQSPLQWKKVEGQLLTMPGVRGWQVRNKADAIINSLVDELSKNKLINKLSIHKRDKAIIIDGLVSAVEEQKIINIIDRLNNNKIIFQNIPPYIPKNLFSGKIIRVSGTKNAPMITLDNGSTLTVGSALNNGYIINEISLENGISISRENELIHIPISYDK
ncbi:T3SS structure protein EscD [Edwardsiella anguillarum ET080813]|uniref:T3SS structure protein EscD n=1 Tax=Edwardsiella anguillarum ET080813 TaxID=667120 RepID=A0A076LMC2_9GAMM|nr:T3SS structure protein EscD [Edwardsiella anguillarum ET080813]